MLMQLLQALEQELTPSDFAERAGVARAKKEPRVLILTSTQH